ncbi:MAG: hypothetical protein COV85_03125, partial [Candidatus Portnoybacteria bacterium CG11_big_fil_rev_8_21_14_0_20_44_10]
HFKFGRVIGCSLEFSASKIRLIKIFERKEVRSELFDIFFTGLRFVARGFYDIIIHRHLWLEKYRLKI